MRSLQFTTLLVCLAAATPAATINYNDRASFTAAATNLSLESFDQAPWANASLGNSLTTGNVTWTAANTLFGSVFSSTSGTLSLSDLDGSSDSVDSLTAELPSGTFSAGASFMALTAPGGVLSAYDAGGQLIGINSAAINFSWFFLGIISDVEIRRVVFTPLKFIPAGGDDFLIDDFTFGGPAAANQVPEPGSAALFGAGLWALALYSRKRSASRKA